MHVFDRPKRTAARLAAGVGDVGKGMARGARGNASAQQSIHGRLDEFVKAHNMAGGSAKWLAPNPEKPKAKDAKDAKDGSDGSDGSDGKDAKATATATADANAPDLTEQPKADPEKTGEQVIRNHNYNHAPGCSDQPCCPAPASDTGIDPASGLPKKLKNADGTVAYLNPATGEYEGKGPWQTETVTSETKVEREDSESEVVPKKTHKRWGLAVVALGIAMVAKYHQGQKAK